MKKFFLKTLYLGIIFCIAGLAGCQNPLNPPPGEAAASPGKGLVVVSIGGAAEQEAARTIAPDTGGFTKYTLAFDGPEEKAPVDLGTTSTSLELSVGEWTITATGYTGTDPDYIEAAQGSAVITVESGATLRADITLGPISGGGQGTFSYSIRIPSGLSGAELKISTPAGVELETIPLSYSYAGINGTRSLDPGQYLVRIRLQKTVGDNTLYAGLTEALHIYSGMTSELPQNTFTDDDFSQAVSDLDLTNLVTPPALWETPVTAFSANQYTGTIAWKESDGTTAVTGIFLSNRVYKAVITLTAKTGYTFIGVAADSFSHDGAAALLTSGADDRVVTITFPPTDTQSITGVTVTPNNAAAAQGGTLAFTAAVTGSVTPPQAVNWTVEGNSDPGTAIAADGTLTVAINESASSLTVRAASVADDSQSGTATVSVSAAAVKDIASADDLAKIGVDPAYPLGGRYKITADLTLSNWTPIGSADAPFFGILDGNSRTITITGFDPALVSVNSYLGIFGYVKGGSETSKAELKSLAIVSSVNEGSTHTTGQAVGLLAGYTEYADISSIRLQGTLGFGAQRNTYVGGIIGFAKTGSVIKDCTGSLNMDIAGGSGMGIESGMYYNYTGGFVGTFKNGVDILNCHNTGDVKSFCTLSGSQVFAGGIAGGSVYSFSTEYQGKIEDCSFSGTVHAKAMGFWAWAGGIAGAMVGDGDGTPEKTTRIVACYVTGIVSVAGTSSGYPYVGGVVGYNYYGALVSQSYFTGTVIADKSGDYTGGIAGYNSQTAGHNSRIEDCWSAGTVSGYNNAGGIVGQNQVNTYIRRCYSTAVVRATGTGGTVGGIAGTNASANPEALTGSVALNPLIEASGNTANIHRIVGGGISTQNINNLAWSGMVVSTGGIYTPDIGADKKDGATTLVQPSQAEYEALGWDFNTVWEMDSYGYPKLRWQQGDTPRPPLAGPTPLVSVENYNHYDTDIGTFTTNEGGKITITWKPVPGATSYDVYYAPRTTTVPAFESAALVQSNVTSTTIEITDTGIGENTMNYFAWVKAYNPAGNALSVPASTLEFWQGTWEVSNGMGDYYYITNADVLYDFWNYYGFMAYIRAVLPADVDTFNGYPGSAGVIIIEYDRDFFYDEDTNDEGLEWTYTPGKFFNALYYYGAKGSGGPGSSAYIGAASNQTSPSAGSETSTFNEAKAKFTFADIEDHYGVASGVDYLWTE
jgi:hypothetical protein